MFLIMIIITTYHLSSELVPITYPITITINDEVDTYGQQGPVVVEQIKEEREAKVPKVYLGNVIWI